MRAGFVIRWHHWSPTRFQGLGRRADRANTVDRRRGRFDIDDMFGNEVAVAVDLARASRVLDIHPADRAWETYIAKGALLDSTCKCKAPMGQTCTLDPSCTSSSPALIRGIGRPMGACLAYAERD